MESYEKQIVSNQHKYTDRIIEEIFKIGDAGNEYYKRLRNKRTTENNQES
jgi:hypothetical protein